MTGTKQWTVLVWVAGDNDLERYGAADLQEMKQVGSGDHLDVIAQFDRMSDHHTRRYHLRKGTPLEADSVDDLGETNTGDPKVAIDFFAWGIRTYPAKHYLAVLWNHGSGIDESDVFNRLATRGRPVHRKGRPSAGAVPRSRLRTVAASRYRHALFSTTVDLAAVTHAIAIDDTSRDFLDNVELKHVLVEVKKHVGRKIDVVGFDACLMNMLEIAYQLREAADISVGSEEVEPGDGWPYNTILGDLAAHPGMPPAQLAGTIVRRYVESYTGGAVTLSALDLRQASAVATVVDELARALGRAIKEPTEYAAVTKAMHATQSYELKSFLDLYDFCAKLKARVRSRPVKEASQAVMATLAAGNGQFVLAERHKGSAVAASHGVSVYFPRGDVTVAYPRLDFARATHWDEFFRAYGRG